MSSSPYKHSAHSWLMDLTGIICLSGLFYVLWLGHHPLFTPDEGRYCEVAREMVASGDYITPRLNGVAFLDKPALYYWLQASAIHFFGLREWALRLWPALLGVLGCTATFATGRILFSRRTGWLGAVLLATSPMYYGGAHYANLDLEVAVLISLTLFALICGLREPDKRLRSALRFIVWPLAALAFLTKGMIALAFPGIVTALWLSAAGQWHLVKRMHLMTGPLIFTVIVLPWYLLVEKANPGFFHFFFITQQVSRFLAHGDFNNLSPWWFYLPVVLAGFLPWSIFALQSIGRVIREKGLKSTDGFFLLWFATVLIFFSIPKSKTIGYILPVFPPLALMTARWLDVHAHELLSRQKLSLILFFTLAWGVLPGVALGTFLQHHPLWPWLAATSVLLIFGGGLMLRLVRTGATVGNGFYLLAAIALGFCLLFLGSAPELNHDSIKPLAVQLKSTLQADDEVITYYKYWQDLPLYLQKRITIVADWQAADIPERDNWVRELWYGIGFQNTADWLISEKTLWERWHSDRHVVVLLDKRRFQKFDALSGNTVRQHGEYGEVAWVSNY